MTTDEVLPRPAEEPPVATPEHDVICRLAQLVEELTLALESRTLIGQATGWVMAQDGLSADEAMAHLIRRSQDSNTKLRIVCAELVAEAECRADALRSMKSDKTG
jgi:AmiR/NasT family two-component response regulator